MRFWGLGVGSMFNATTPFIQATWTNDTGLAASKSFADPDVEPPLPDYPKAYGHNTLLLSEQAAAMLDIPLPSWTNMAQSLLQPGESLNITATVTAVITTYNNTIDQNRDPVLGESDFWDYYNNQGGLKTMTIYNGWNAGLLTNYAMTTNRDQSWCFIGVFKDPADNFTSFVPTAKMYNSVRAPCTATWTVTRGALELMEGMCEPSRDERSATYAQNQRVLTDNQLAFPDRYLSPLVELLGRFTNDYESRWKFPTMSVVAASMIWSRIVGRNGPASMDFADEGSLRYSGLLYNTNPTIVHTRPTLRNSPWLFLLFAIQPFATVLMTIGSVLLYRVPVSKGFGVAAILAGVHPESLRVLRGAAFTGKLKEQVKFNIHVSPQDGRAGELRYTLGTHQETPRSRVRRRWYYS